MENIDQLSQIDNTNSNVSTDSTKNEQNSARWMVGTWYRVKSNTEEGIKSNKKDVIIIQAKGVRSMDGQELLEKLSPDEVEKLEGAEKLFISKLEHNSQNKY